MLLIAPSIQGRGPVHRCQSIRQDAGVAAQTVGEIGRGPQRPAPDLLRLVQLLGRNNEVRSRVNVGPLDRGSAPGGAQFRF